jgi:hypothetical protein
MSNDTINTPFSKKDRPFIPKPLDKTNESLYNWAIQISQVLETSLTGSIPDNKTGIPNKKGGT